MAERIDVKTPNGSYPIIIERGILQHIGDYAAEFGLDRRTVVATNTTIAPLHGDSLVARLPNATPVAMRDGEQFKTLETVRQLYADFVEAGLDRGGTVVALGGGVVGDTIGFAAATYMRGVGLIQAPTSLLAMVDSSVGGKVGVDLPQGKNLVGAFKQPEAVLIDPDTLETLPEQEWRCGMAETIKHGLLADAGLLDSDLHVREHAPELIRRAIQVKVDVVEQDPFEHGVRAHLNLGHTFGHAIEQVTHYQWAHGEAVGVGLLCAAKLSHLLSLCDAELVDQVDDILAKVGLPRRTGGLDPEALYAAMFTDKKWKNGLSRFVLLHGVGQPLIMEGIEASAVIETLTELR
jgi:3-dehydroquinate synthase